MSSLTLVDTDTAQPIPQFNPIASGSTINLATLPSHNLTIQANTSPATIGSVAFDLVNSGYLNTVNTAPYDLCGTAPCSNLGVGLHSLTTTPYMGPNASGGAGTSMSISFSVIDPTPTPTSLPTPSPAPTPIGGITPPALVNPQNPLNYGADSTGTHDSTSAFQSAINAGDVHVTAGHYLILGNLYFPSNRHMQCDLNSSNQPTAFLQNPSQTSGYMILMNSTTNSSIFYCGFRGPNADLNAQTVASANNDAFIFIQGANGNGNQLVGDDFNGIGGQQAAVMVYASNSTQPPPNGTIISWNTFEHCGYYAVQLTSATNTTISHNTANDCSGMIEPDDTGQANTGNVVDSNHMTFTYGVGCRQQYESTCYGFDGLTCGAAPETGFNFSGNTCTNNIVDGPHSSTICAVSPCSHGDPPANYTSNTCTGGCVMNDYGQ